MHPPLALVALPFEWDLGVQALLEQNRERVLYDPTFKYIRDMIMRTNAHNKDEEED